MVASGSLLWASKPAEIIITSGSKRSTLTRIFSLKTLKNSSLEVPALIGALKMFPAPISDSNPVPGNKGC